MSILMKSPIGSDVFIHESAVVSPDVMIGNRVNVAANVVLGAEGLEFKRQLDGTLTRSPHTSKLIIGDDVEICANTTIQRGVHRPTIIGAGTKIGPNCNIGHQANIGEHCLIIGGVMLAGSVHIGHHSVIGACSVIRNGVKIGNNAFVGMGSVVVKDVADNTKVVGNPAMPLEQFKQRRKKLKKLLECTNSSS